MTTYCVFNVGERRLGIVTAHVREIVEPHLVCPTAIPLTPPCVQGLFNLRGQVLPLVDLAPLVGAVTDPGAVSPESRLGTGDSGLGTYGTGLGTLDSGLGTVVIVERGQFRFATMGRRLDSVEVDPSRFQPLESAALYPALEAQAQTERGSFDIIHLDRLEACLGRALKSTAAPAADPVIPSSASASPRGVSGPPVPMDAATPTPRGE
jgi:hypothetical protein